MRILLVEDHRDTAAVLARLLRRDGHDVNTAATADDALAACDARNVDLLICDIGLPDHDGWELLPRVRERHAVPAVALTGYGTEADLARSRAAGYDLHLTKPIDVATLRAAVAKCAPAPASAAPPDASPDPPCPPARAGPTEKRRESATDEHGGSPTKQGDSRASGLIRVHPCASVADNSSIPPPGAAAGA